MRREIGAKWRGPGFCAIFWPSYFLSEKPLMAELLGVVLHEGGHELDRDRRLKYVSPAAEFRRQLAVAVRALDRPTPASKARVADDHGPKWAFRVAVMVHRLRHQGGLRLTLSRVLGYDWQTAECSMIEQDPEARVLTKAAALDWKRWLSIPTPAVYKRLWEFHNGDRGGAVPQHQKVRGKTCPVLLAS
jgi:hypothetical protein